MKSGIFHLSRQVYLFFLMGIIYVKSKSLAYKHIECVPSYVYLAAFCKSTYFDSLSVCEAQILGQHWLAEEKTILLAKGIIPTAKLINVPVNLIELIWLCIYLKQFCQNHLYSYQQMYSYQLDLVEKN